MEILGCHPLYDHNNAFDIEYMKNKYSNYQFDYKNIRDAAKIARNRVDFHFTKEITRDLFITDRQYKEFVSRAKDLQIRTIL